jgi:acyl CoA:acetate/3-ketoacid CoA transferase alpha subunit
MAVGTPENLVDTLIEQGTGDLTVICNDTVSLNRDWQINC